MSCVKELLQAAFQALLRGDLAERDRLCQEAQDEMLAEQTAERDVDMIAVPAYALITAVCRDFPAFWFFPEHVGMATAAAATGYAAARWARGEVNHPNETLAWVGTEAGRQTIAGIAWCMIEGRSIGCDGEG